MSATRQELIQQITAERDAYTEALANSRTIDELFERTMKEKGTLNENQLADYQYYCEKRAAFEQDFEQFAKQFVWGRSENEWPADPTRRQELRKYRAAQKVMQYTDFFAENEKDERFVNGASLARFVEADKDLTLRAANLIREKQREYDSLNPVARFFSYLNPFSNKYRTMRNEIERITVKTAKITGCPQEKLEQYANGKTADLEYIKQDGYEFDTISNSIQTTIVRNAPLDLSDDDFSEELENDLRDPLTDLFPKKEYTKEELDLYERLDGQYKNIPLEEVRKELETIRETRQSFFNLDSNVRNALTDKIKNDKIEHRQKMEDLEPTFRDSEQMEQQSKSLGEQIEEYKTKLETLKTDYKEEADNQFIKISEEALNHAKEQKLTSKDSAKWAVETFPIYGKTLGDIDKIPKENTTQIENLQNYYDDIREKIADYVVTAATIERAEKEKAELDNKIAELADKKAKYLKEKKIVKKLDEEARVDKYIKTADTVFDYKISSLAPDYEQKKREFDSLAVKSSELSQYVEMRAEKEAQLENAPQNEQNEKTENAPVGENGPDQNPELS